MSGEYAIVVPKGDHTVSVIYQRVSNTCSLYPGNGVLIVEPVPFLWDLGTYGFGVFAAEGGAPGSLQGLQSPETVQSGEPIE